MSRAGLLCASVLACALACNGDDSPAGEGNADDSGSAADTGTSAAQETSDTASSGDGDGDGDPTTGDGDGDPTTGDGDGDPTTGDGDGDPTTGDGDGDGDPTTGDGDGDGDPTGDGDGDGDPTGDGDGDGDPMSPYYGACPMNQDDECQPGEFCLDQVFENWQVCTSNCEGVDDCPPAPPNTTVECLPIDANIFNKGCFLSCEGNAQCPQGMSCESENLGADYICVFDV